MPAATPGRRPALAVAGPWLALALVLAGSIAVRARLVDVPLERDEGGYAYFGQRLLAGEPPFASGHSLHLPGTTVAYAAALAAFGQSIAGARTGLILAATATVVLAFLLGTRLYGSAGGLAAAAVQATMALSPDLHGPFGHATHFVTLCGVAGLWAFVRALEMGGLGRMALAGLLLGLAPVMKQSGAVFPAFAICWLAASRFRETGRIDARAAGELAVLAGSSAAGVVVTLALLEVAGVGPVARHWLLEYASAYAGMQPLAAGLANLRARASGIAPPAAGFLALAVLGAAVPAVPRPTAPSPGGRAFALLLLAFSFAGAAAGLYFRHHHLLPVVPALALLCGRAVGWAARKGRALPALAAVAASCALAVGARADILLRMGPAQVARAVYGANPFPESIAVARYIASRSAPTDTIAVLGSEPQVCFLAHRRCASRYLYLYPLLEPNPFGPAMREEFMREVESAAPTYVVWVNVPTSWDTRVRAAQGVVEWAVSMLEKGYDLVGRVAIRSPDRTDYAWDDQAARLGPEGASLLVFRRRGH